MIETNLYCTTIRGLRRHFRIKLKVEPSKQMLLSNDLPKAL